MLTSKEFVAKLEKENEPLFRASELQIKHYYENVTDKDELIDNFTGRMVNERMNMEEISREVAALPAGTDPQKLILLSKQAHDADAPYWPNDDAAKEQPDSGQAELYQYQPHPMS